MITYIKGTVFNAPVKTYVNTVNCSGVMGAGIALEFKLRYPKMFDNYVKECENKTMKIGIPRIYEYSNDIWIMNFPTKGHWRYPSKIQWIESGLKYFADNYKKRDIQSIAFPKLGTNNGGLEWNTVKELMEKYLEPLDLKIYICLDEKKEAEGIEKEMVTRLNNITINELINDIKIPKKQSETIIKELPLMRFWHLSKIKGVGEKSYEKLFKYLYNNIEQNVEPSSIRTGEQLSMFLDN
ncbi:MAG: macro domain-containing protein [Clostridium sp.]|nr:macro domain-containing protein [Clostridium sp.]